MEGKGSTFSPLSETFPTTDWEEVDVTYNLNDTYTDSFTTALNSSDFLGPTPGPPSIAHLIFLQNLSLTLDKVIPLTLSMGIVGNVVAILAFVLSPLKLNSLSHYLTALAVADVMNMAACLVTHAWRIYYIVGVCQVTSFVLHMSKFLTTVYLLSSHVERLLVHYGRSGSKRWCTVFRTKCVILSIFVMSTVAFLHNIWSHVVMFNICQIMLESVVHIQRLRRIELVLAMFLPMLVMVVMDVAILVKMVTGRIRSAKTRSSSGDRMLTCLKAKGDHRSTDKDYALADNGEVTALSHHAQHGKTPLTNGTSTRKVAATSTTTNTNSAQADEAAALEEAARRMDLNKEKTRCTVMVMVAGLVFIGLTLPSICLRAHISFAENRPSLLVRHLMQLFEKINQFNGVYKVVLYTLFLRSFRRAVWFSLKNIFLSRCCRKREPVTTV